MGSVPSRSNGPRPKRPVREITPGTWVEDLQTDPILDGSKSVRREGSGEGASLSQDLPLVLADWFLGRADPTGEVWLWTGTFDPDRLKRGTRGGAPRDRVGHRGAIDALSSWHRALRAYAPAADVLVGVEAHKSGARHAHAAVVAQDGFRWKWAARVWFDAYGFNRWEAVDREMAAARYAAKYVGKELGVYDVAFGGRDLRL